MKLKYIDALRGLAIFGVLLVHCSQIGQNNYPFFMVNFLNNSSLGVQLFFMVSAFTLFLSFQERIGKERHIIINFFIRRFFRIAPLFYCAIVFYLFLYGTGPRITLGDASRISEANILSNFLFMHGLSPYWINSLVPGGWSVSIEVMFYLLVPFLFTRIKTLNQALKFLIITLLIKLLSDVFMVNVSHSNTHGFWNNFIYYSLPTQLPVFAFGIAMYFLIAHKFNASSIAPSNLFFLGLLILVHILYQYNSITISISMAICLILYSMSQRTLSLVENPFFIFLGRVSFSIYLSHFAVISIMVKCNLIDIISSSTNLNSVINFIIRFSILLTLSSILAFVLYSIIEKPFIRLGKKIIKRVEAVN